MAPHHLAFMVLICLIWGFNFVAGKVGVGEFPPLLFTSLRFVLLALLLVPFLKLHPGRMRTILAIGLFSGSIHFGLMFSALTIANASVIGIASQLNAPFLTLLSIFFLGETVRWKRWLGIALAFSGIAVISFDPVIAQDWPGVLMVAFAALSMAVGMIFMRRIKGVSPMEMQAWIAVLSVAVLLPLSFLMEADQWGHIADASWLAWGAVVYTAVGASLIGHGGIYYLLQRYDASLTGPLTLMAPLFGVFFGVTVLDEPLTVRLVIGGAIAILGVLIIALREGKKPRTPALTEPIAADEEGRRP